VLLSDGAVWTFSIVVVCTVIMSGVESGVLPFHEMGLDDRLQKAIAKLGWAMPTLIQERAIPLILEGKDVLARGRTGSGKTGAFVIPVVQRILQTKVYASQQEVRALMLAPSREVGR
jgi:ATP-dependent RNA helicase DDX56/DBP9